MSFFSRVFKSGAARPPPSGSSPPSAPSQPLHVLISPRSADVLSQWAPHLGTHSEVVGYSALGHFFLRDPAGQDYLVLHSLTRGSKRYGRHASAEAFEAAVLRDPGFVSHVLQPALVEELARRLGPLGADQVYYPAPYPCLGGSGAVETYDKGHVWVFASFIAQAHGL